MYNNYDMTTYESLFILGRQPSIGKAELESVFSKEHLEPVGEFAMASDLTLSQIPFKRLGGSIRLAKSLFNVSTNKWSDIRRQLIKELPGIISPLPEGKIKLGLSSYGLGIETSDLFHVGLDLKKICKANGHSARIIPNTELALNTAQVTHNQLTGNLGVELLLIQDGEKTCVAQTTDIQDIEAYTERDRERPKRDAFVGMLPPKLAQIIVNLGVSQLEPYENNVVLDPFCGTGVALQEAILMGYNVYGTDLESRMVNYSRVNLEWLLKTNLDGRATLENGDATTYKWKHNFEAVASEAYLGHPITTWPSPDKLREIINTCNTVIQKFLINIASQIPSGTRLCIAVPAWQSPSGQIYHLPLLDQIENLGYNRVSFSFTSDQDMVYSRPDQFVARELLVITRNA